MFKSFFFTYKKEIMGVSVKAEFCRLETAAKVGVIISTAGIILMGLSLLFNKNWMFIVAAAVASAGCLTIEIARKTEKGGREYIKKLNDNSESRLKKLVIYLDRKGIDMEASRETGLSQLLKQAKKERSMYDKNNLFGKILGFAGANILIPMLTTFLTLHFKGIDIQNGWINMLSIATICFGVVIEIAALSCLIDALFHTDKQYLDILIGDLGDLIIYKTKVDGWINEQKLSSSIIIQK